MTTKVRKVTKSEANQVLQLVAAWLGQRGMGQIIKGEYVAVAPVGKDAAYHAYGPMLNMTWGWPSSGPTPTVLLEGGYDDWAVECCYDVQQAAKAKGLDVFVEPYAGYALCVYPG